MKASTDPTEHHLQGELTRRWVMNGFEIGGRRHMLIAWEVMVPSWRINDASQYFSEPSIDFLLADSGGRLLAMELKRKVLSASDAWKVLAQVTHRAFKLRETLEPERLESAWRACHSGQHGRVPPASPPPLDVAYSGFFGINAAVEWKQTVGRAVAALKFGKSFPAAMAAFNTLTWHDLKIRLQEEPSLRASKDVQRLLDLPVEKAEVMSPIMSLLLSDGT